MSTPGRIWIAANDASKPHRAGIWYDEPAAGADRVEYVRRDLAEQHAHELGEMAKHIPRDYWPLRDEELDAANTQRQP